MTDEHLIYRQVLELADKGIHFEEFKRVGRFESDKSKSYDSLMYVLDDLIRQKIVKLDSNFLSINKSVNFEDLKSQLAAGDPIAWEISDFIPNLSQKFQQDSTLLLEIGLSGEEYVMKLLQLNIPLHAIEQLKHVSKYDDTLGYDLVAPRLTDFSPISLEIKTTTRNSEKFNFYLSRNEWEAAQRVQDWYIVFVQKLQGAFSIFGHLNGQSLIAYFPSDQNRLFKWQSSSGQFARDDIFPGLPPGLT